MLLKLINKLPKSICRSAGRVYLVTKQHLPDILTYGGMIGCAGSTVWACKSTLKADKLIRETQEQLSHLDKEKDKVERGKITRKLVRDVAKIYAAPTAAELISMLMIGRGHHLVKMESAALAVAYNELYAKFMDLRKKALGKDSDGHYIEQKSEDPNKQDICPVEESDKQFEVYVVRFDDTSEMWTGDRLKMYTNIKQKIAWSTDILRKRGWYTYAEMLAELGMNKKNLDPNVALMSNHFGWWDDDINELPKYIWAGIEDPNEPDVQRFLNREVDHLDLVFNVDGNLDYHRMEMRRKYDINK